MDTSPGTEKVVKFHGLEVENVVVRYTQRDADAAAANEIIEFNARKDTEVYQTVNIQVVSDYVTISFYRDEANNDIMRRELIPSHAIEHIWVSDLHKEQ